MIRCYALPNEIGDLRDNFNIRIRFFVTFRRFRSAIRFTVGGVFGFVFGRIALASWRVFWTVVRFIVFGRGAKLCQNIPESFLADVRIVVFGGICSCMTCWDGVESVIGITRLGRWIWEDDSS